MSFTDTAIAALVLFGVFFLAYSAIRKQGIRDTIAELRDAFDDKKETILNPENLKYA